MGILIFLSHYETWLIWVIVLLALCLGRILSGAVKRLSTGRRKYYVRVKFKWVPIIGEIRVERRRVGRLVFNRYALFECVHTLSWVLMYQKFGATFWLLFGLPIMSVLLMMLFVLRAKRRIPMLLNLVLGILVVLM